MRAASAALSEAPDFQDFRFFNFKASDKECAGFQALPRGWRESDAHAH